MSRRAIHALCCWSVIAVSLVVRLWPRSLAPGEETGYRPETGWLLLVDAAPLAVVLLVWLWARLRARRPLGTELDRPSRHGAVYLEAFALAWALRVGAIPTLRPWVRFWFADITTLAVALLYVSLRTGRIREALAEIGIHRGRGVFREAAIGVLAGCLLLPLRGWLERGWSWPPHWADVSLALNFLLWNLPVVSSGPLYEEFLYRGLLYRHLRDRWRWLPSAIVCSLLFMLTHLPATRWPGVFAFGMLIATLREWRGSLIAPLTAHVLTNTVWLLLFFL